jgi:hypothetical protein
MEKSDAGCIDGENTFRSPYTRCHTTEVLILTWLACLLPGQGEGLGQYMGVALQRKPSEDSKTDLMLTFFTPASAAAPFYS